MTWRCIVSKLLIKCHRVVKSVRNLHPKGAKKIRAEERCLEKRRSSNGWQFARAKQRRIQTHPDGSMGRAVLCIYAPLRSQSMFSFCTYWQYIDSILYVCDSPLESVYSSTFLINSSSAAWGSYARCLHLLLSGRNWCSHCPAYGHLRRSQINGQCI